MGVCLFESKVDVIDGLSRQPLEQVVDKLEACDDLLFVSFLFCPQPLLICA